IRSGADTQLTRFSTGAEDLRWSIQQGAPGAECLVGFLGRTVLCEKAETLAVTRVKARDVQRRVLQIRQCARDEGRTALSADLVIKGISRRAGVVAADRRPVF